MVPSSDTVANPSRIGRLGRVRWALACVIMAVVVGCASSDTTTEAPTTTTEAPTTTTEAPTTAVADVIQGAWYWADQGVYEMRYGDGRWSVAYSPSGVPWDWGTYTFENGVLTYFNADGSECSGAVAVWEVVFSEDGDEVQETFVSDTCNSIRGQDRVLVKNRP